MARFIFGGEVTNIGVMEDATTSAFKRLTPGTAMPWRTTPGGAVVTDFLLWDGSAFATAASSIVADANGYAPAFQGPDAVSLLYDPLGYVLRARDASSGGGDAAGSAAAAQAYAIQRANHTGTQTVSTLSDFVTTIRKTDAVNIASAGVYPIRTAATTDTLRRVRWVGTTAPTIGGSYAITGLDIWEKTP